MTELTDQRTHVVVVGGGYAGTMAANHLRQRPDIDITLVNPRPVFVERIRLHQLVADSGTATVDYGTLLGDGIRLVVDSADRIDTDDRVRAPGLGRRAELRLPRLRRGQRRRSAGRPGGARRSRIRLFHRRFGGCTAFALRPRRPAAGTPPSRWWAAV